VQHGNDAVEWEILVPLEVEHRSQCPSEDNV
jgi:hypothetical protein